MNPFYFSANAQLPGYAHQIIHVALHQLPVLIRRQIDHHHIICLFKNAIIPDDLLRVHQRFVCIRIGIKPTELLAGTDRLLKGKIIFLFVKGVYFRVVLPSHVRIPQPKVRGKHPQRVTVTIIPRLIAFLRTALLFAVFPNSMVHANLAHGLHLLYMVI